MGRRRIDQSCWLPDDGLLGRQKQQRGEDTDGRPLAQVYFCFWKASRDGSRQKGLTAERRLSPSTGTEANDLLP